MKGNYRLPLPSHGSLRIDSDGPFTAYWLSADGERIGIAGPEGASARRLVCPIPRIAAELEISAKPSVMTIAKVIDHSGKEPNDPTPVEVPLSLLDAPTLEDQIRSMVYQVSAELNASKNVETFEEANDFGEADDEELDFFSKYEIMEEEIPVSELPPEEAKAPEGSEKPPEVPPPEKKEKVADEA